MSKNKKKRKEKRKRKKEKRRNQEKKKPPEEGSAWPNKCVRGITSGITTPDEGECPLTCPLILKKRGAATRGVTERGQNARG